MLGGAKRKAEDNGMRSVPGVIQAGGVEASGLSLAGAKGKPEDAATRSVSAAARGVHGARERTLALLHAFLRSRGSGAPSTAPLTRLARILLPPAFALALLLTSAPPAASAAVFLEGPPKFGDFQTFEVRATRARVNGVIYINGATTTWTIRYSTSKALVEEGKGTLAAEGTCNFLESHGQYDEQCSGPGNEHPQAVLTGLIPATTYYVRIKAKNDFGPAHLEGEFTTTPVGPPKFIKPPDCSYEIGGNLCIVGQQPGPSSASFKAAVYADGADSTYHFEYSTSKTVLEEGKGAAIPAAEGSVTAAAEVGETEFHLEGLTPETTYYLRGVAKNKEGATTPIATFETHTDHPESFRVNTITAVKASSAHLAARVWPNDHETHWRFESAIAGKTCEPPAEETGCSWVPGAGGTIPQSEAAYVEGGKTVEADLTGLNPETVYWVRVFAESEPEAGHVFTSTSAATGFETAGPPRAETFALHEIHGESLRALGSVEPHGYHTHYRVQYVSQADFKESEWAKADETPELDAGSGEFTLQSGYPTVNVGADLPGLQPGLTYVFRLLAKSEAGEAYGKARTLTVPNPTIEPSPACENERFRTGPSAHLPDCRAYEQVTPLDKGGAYEITQYNGSLNEGGLVGEDGDHLMLAVPQTHWGHGPAAGDSPYFFARTSSGWQMTAATPEPEAGIASYVQQVLSPDLTRLGFTTIFGTSSASLSNKQEYRLGPPGGPYTTVATVPSSQIASSEGDGWVAASEDFSKLILQLHARELVKGHPTGTAQGPDLYEYSAQAGLRQANVDTTGATIGSCGARVVRGREESGERSSRHTLSADGSRLFFYASAPAKCATESELTNGSGPNVNLYLRTNGAETTDIGEYSFLEADSAGSTLLIAHNGLFRYDTATRAAEPVSEGESLTHVRYSYSSAGQILRRDSAENSVECISCASPFDPEPKLPVNTLTHGILDGPAPNRTAQPRLTFASANGDYAFFDTPAALLPEDVNGEIYPEGLLGELPGEFSRSSDVYEWRRDGLNGCSRLQGCLSLISSGTDGYLVELLGTAHEGRDVFFITASQLLSRDKDSQLDVYDARIGGGFAEPAQPVECEGDACSHPVPAPNDPTPNSENFHGAGNEHPAGHKHHKKHHRKKHHKRSHKRAANSNRRTGK